MRRKACCAKEGLNRGAWTALEDQILMSYIKTHGEGKWRNLPKKAEFVICIDLNRCGKSCHLRWLNYLRPGIKQGNISIDEEELIIRLHRLLGNRWSLIAGHLPGRTDNEIKNYWNTTLVKKVREATKVNKDDLITNYLDPFSKRARAKEAPNPAKIDVIIQTKAQRCTRTFFQQEQLLLQPSPPLSLNYSQQLHQLLPSVDPSEELLLQQEAQKSAEEVVEDPRLSLSLDDDFFFQGLSENLPKKECSFNQLHAEFDLTSMDSLLDKENEWMNLLNF